MMKQAMDNIGNGGETNKQTLVSQVVEVRHHLMELESVLSKIKNSDVENWVLLKAERLSTDISDITHYLEAKSNESADTSMMERGGRASFKDKVSAISDRLEGTKVPDRLKKDYGETYDEAEAEEAARRIAGAQLRDLQMMEYGGMMAKGGSIDKFNPKSLVGKLFYGKVNHGEIIDINVISDDNIRVVYAASRGLNIDKSYTKDELFRMSKGESVYGETIYTMRMEGGGYMDKDAIIEEEEEDEDEYQGNDLLDEYEYLPKDVQNILDRYENLEPDAEIVEKMKKELNRKGYTFSYGLDYEPYNLRLL